MQRVQLVAGDEVDERVRQPLEVVRVALEDENELEHHRPLLLLQIRR
jgi:hypothetical protein